MPSIILLVNVVGKRNLLGGANWDAIAVPSAHSG